LALNRLFEGQIAACELAGPRSSYKLKNRTNTFLSNPLCRVVGELCTNQLEVLETAVQVHEKLQKEVKEVPSSAEYVGKGSLLLCKEVS
jgi:hypothetical protein